MQAWAERRGRSRPMGVLLALALVVAACSGSHGSGTPTWLAKLTVRARTVQVRTTAAGSFAAGRDGQELVEGTTLRTDRTGRAQVDYADGSLTRLGADTEFALRRLAARTGPRVTLSHLRVGETYHRVQKLTESGDRYEVDTASLTAAVKGTRFIVVCTRSGTCFVIVIDGHVEVRSKRTHAAHLLGPSQQVTVSADGRLGPVVDLSPDQLAANAWVQENLRLDRRGGAGTTTSVPAAGGQPNAAALRSSKVTGRYAVTLTAMAATGFRDVHSGQHRTRTYRVETHCTGGRCDLVLVQEAATGSHRIPLTYSHGTYTAEEQGFATQDCVRSDGTVATRSGFHNSATIELHARDATVRDGTWQARALAGTAHETATPTAAATRQGCVAGDVAYSLTARRAS